MILDRHRFARSRRGNLWCRLGEWTLTVFQRNDGGWAWCLTTGDDPRFPRHSFESESHALDDLLEEVSGR
jgi:hypothetical protein